MTIEQLLGLTADEFDKLTDEQLLEYFKEYRHITRPELAAKPDKVSPRKLGDKSPRMSNYESKLAKAREIAAQFGLKLNV